MIGSGLADRGFIWSWAINLRCHFKRSSRAKAKIRAARIPYRVPSADDLPGRVSGVLAVLFLVFNAARLLVRSPFGLSLKGVREGERRMPAIGVSVPRKLVAVYTVGAGIAGVAGALLAQTTQFVGIDVFGFQRSAELMIMLVLGGTGYLYGGLLGAAVFMILQDYLANLNPVYWQFWLGLLLVVLVLFARGGLLGGLVTLRRRFAKP